MTQLQRKTGNEVRRRGLSAVEVIVVLAIMALFALFLVMMLPRRRETARMVSCRRNLMQIGVALTLYDQARQFLPTVPDLGDASAAGASSPLTALLLEFGLPDLTGLDDTRGRPPKQPNLTQEARRVPGFVCPSDPHAIAGLFPAPVNYRATTGDAPDGRDGAFAPGRRVSIKDVEATDGSGYTAAFSERLVGDHTSEHPAPFNYALVPAPLPDAGCPQAAPPAWRGDAGSSWVASNWQSTLYNHALTPDAVPSCIADDRRSAFMGASSGHEGGVNVLFFDGSVRIVTPQVDPKIWRDWAAFPQVPAQPPEGLPRPSAEPGPTPGPGPG
jgi:prepilin-type processing-associated H-X9-DG protein/prepilin-type N-terminal cleavage/methylation domain-containing protein